MRLRLIVIFFLLLFSRISIAQQRDTAFQKEWLDIDTLIAVSDLTKTALAKTMVLYHKAKQRQLPVHVIKSLLYEYSLQDKIQALDPNPLLKTMESEIANTKDETEKAILHSIVAKLYRQYFYAHRWNIYNRKKTTARDRNDITTWSADDFVAEIAAHFLHSLDKSNLLQEIKTADYRTLIIEGNDHTKSQTIFDLLLHEALDYFKTGDAYSTRPVHAFVLNDPKALGKMDDFINTVFVTRDSSSQQWITLLLFQKGLSAHRNDIDKNELLELNIERLEWVYTFSNIAGKDIFFRETLEEITTKYASTRAASEAWFRIAQQEFNTAADYQPFGDTTHRYGMAKAKELAEKALLQYKEKNRGVINLLNLIADINRKELRTQTEKVNIPGKAFRALTTYRNIDTLYGRVLKMDNVEYLRSNFNNKEFWEQLTHSEAYSSFKQALPPTNDYQLHSTEIKIDPLPAGEYVLLTSASTFFNDSTGKLSAQFFYVSAISYVQNENDFFVLNRETGKPLANVKVSILKQVYSNTSKKTIGDTVSVQRTDKNGYCSYKPTSTGNYQYVFTLGTDRLNIKTYNYLYADNAVTETGTPEERSRDFEKENNRVFFFTDRSIYRPGQTLFFKGIAVTKDYKTHLSKIIGQDSDWVYLGNTNGKHIDSIKLVLNEYGSYAGKFVLPQRELTGTFFIESKNYDDNRSYFSVEEYKRPTFSVSFDKTKGAYHLNDSVTVTGVVKAYAGNAIGDAKLVFSIQRKTRFTNVWSSNGFSASANREISNGILMTDANGKFTIRFKALADDILDKKENALFDFSVTADVTDQTGETRNSQTKITVGYASLLVDILAPEVSEVDSLTKIPVLTTNLSNELEPAKVHIKIEALLAPDRLVRKRYWQRPDQFVMPKETFAGYFPEDEYEEESNYATWPVERIVSEGTVDTKNQKAFTIAPGTSHAGYYKIETSTKDKYDAEVKTVQYIQLYNSKKDQTAYPVYQLNYILNGTAEPGQKAMFISGSSVDHLFVIRKTDRPVIKKNSYEFIERGKGFEKINYRAEESDRGGVNISDVFVYNNRVYTASYRVEVPWNNKKLNISYATYRDKTEPGAKETWTLSIQNEKNEKSVAELLTSMYDASLDQFKPHDWQIPGIWESYYSRNVFIDYMNFTIEYARESNVFGPRLFNYNIVYDHLAYSGTELWEKDLVKLADSTLPISVDLRKNISVLKDVTVVGYAASGKRDVTGSVAGNLSVPGIISDSTKIQIRGMSANNGQAPLYIIDGVKSASVNEYDVSDIESISILESAKAMALYGSSGANGAVIISTKSKKIHVPTRKNFNETAFFFPQLHADSTGTYRFSFTMPEAVTQWKWMSIAHTKDLSFGANSANIITQKKLMVQSNEPRFMREGDNMEFSSKIVNLTDKEITGQATLELIDAASNTSVDGWFQNVFPSQYFTVEAGQSFAVKFPIQIPFSFNRALTWRVVARSGEYSDGEENTLPVVTNRALVTETQPLFLPKDTTVNIVFDKLLHNTSETLTQAGITVEYSSNPVWYAVQALPYLMEYPYECTEQTFNRFYANVFASFIVNKHPRIKEIFERWKADSSSLKSNLQKNEELKQVLLEETPWVLDAANETQQKKNIALLFDLVKLDDQTRAVLQKLQSMQLANGAFSWFNGGYEDRWITNYILTGIGKLIKAGVLKPALLKELQPMITKALSYLDAKATEDYNQLVKTKLNLKSYPLHADQIDYLYLLSFFKKDTMPPSKAYAYFLAQGKTSWIKQNNYYKAKLGLVYYRNGDEKFATGLILPALLENTVSDSRLGMYWKTCYTNAWYQSPVEHQSMMIAFFSEINQQQKNISLTRDIDQMKIWLLLNKQTNHWGTTIATADACYALLLNGSDWTATDKKVNIQLGKTVISNSNETAEAGTGYFKERIDAKEVDTEMGNITVTTVSQSPNKNSSPSWGSVYWQYFEELDKITSTVSPLSVRKKLFIEKNTDKGKILEPVKENDELKTGDKIVVRLEIRSDRDMDYIHLKDMRAAGMEPTNVLSSYKWHDGLGYYESTRDASTNFFISHLPKGTFVFDYPLFISQTGIFSVGIATIECMYAPQFSSHSEGIKIRAKS